MTFSGHVTVIAVVPSFAMVAISCSWHKALHSVCCPKKATFFCNGKENDNVANPNIFRGSGRACISMLDGGAAVADPESFSSV